MNAVNADPGLQPVSKILSDLYPGLLQMLGIRCESTITWDDIDENQETMVNHHREHLGSRSADRIVKRLSISCSSVERWRRRSQTRLVSRLRTNPSLSVANLPHNPCD